MKIKNKKGIAIIWTMVTGSIMLLSAMVMINATVKESKMVMNFAASTKVSNAAKSGITWANWCINHRDECGYNSPEVRSFKVDGIDITVRINDQVENDKTVYYVDSLGSDEKVVRKFSYRFAGKQTTSVYRSEFNNDGAFAGARSFFLLNPQHPNSFSLAYSFWVSAYNNNKTMTVYMHNRNAANPADLVNSLQVKYFNNFSKPYLTLDYAGNPTAPKMIPLYKPEDLTQTQYINTTEPFKVNIIVNYIKNVNISLTVRIKSEVSGSLPEISYRKTLSALGVDFGSINQVTLDGQFIETAEPPTVNLGEVCKINMQQNTYFYITNIEHWGNP